MVDFLHPQFLWGLPLVVLPVVIHLLSRLRYRRVPWAAMMHLVRAERRSRRRLRWQNLLLLLLRCAAVLLLVLLFAQPVLSRPLPGLAGGPRAHVVLILDDSASMAQVSEGESAFDRARAFVLAAAGKFAGTGSSMTVAAASEARPFFRAAPFRPEDVPRLREALQGRGATAGSFDVAWALRGEPYAAIRDVSFYVLTDLRAADWGGPEPYPEARRALEALQKYGEVCVVDVGAEPGPNAGITEVLGADRPAYARTPADLRIVIANDGPEPFGPAVVEVQLDGRPLPPLPAPAVPPGESRQVPGEAYLDSPGCHALEFSLRTGDCFRPDDARFVALEAVEQLRVLAVEGSPEGAPGLGSAYFLRMALQPARWGGGIQVETQPAGAGPRADLAGYDAVFLCDLGSPAAWREALERYVKGGGRLAVFLGGRADADAWNAGLLGDSGLIPCRLESRVRADAAAPFRIADIDFSDPLLAPFSGWAALFGMARFTGVWRVEALPGARAVARFDGPDGPPAMLVARAGDGLAVLFPTTANDEWTDWPVSDAGRVTYLSLMQWLVEQGRASARPALNLAGGEGAQLPLDVLRYRPQATLVPPQEGRQEGSTPAGELLRALSDPLRAGLWFVTEPLNRQGIWRLQLSGRGEATSGSAVYLAVNIRDGERLLARTSLEAVKSAQARPPRLRALRYGGPEVERVLKEPAVLAGQWSLVAWALVAALIAESVLAFVFGNPAQAHRRGPRLTRRTVP